MYYGTFFLTKLESYYVRIDYKAELNYVWIFMWTMYFKVLKLYMKQKFLTILRSEFILHFPCCVQNIFLTTLPMSILLNHSLKHGTSFRKCTENSFQVFNICYLKKKILKMDVLNLEESNFKAIDSFCGHQQEDNWALSSWWSSKHHLVHWIASFSSSD